ncbi:MAG TPA: hypothetical protein VGR92_17495 [Steroidobacteraceae bacterium]|nr:hypothetical protein [Steroidobacteraceae bacterium]
MSKILVAACLAAACLSAPLASANQETPYIPSSDDVVLQTLPSIADPRVRAFDALRDQQARAPGDLGLSVKLSMAYLDYGRGTGDARYLGRAAAVIAPWLRRQPAPLPVLLVHATILQSKHYFPAARAVLMEVLRRQPDNEQAWLTLATVAQVQGDYGTARKSCAYLLGGGDLLVPLVCLSSLNAITGRAARSARMLEALWPQARSQPVAVQSWMQGIMADTANYLGDYAAADRHFRAALQLTPGDNFLLADYGDFLLDQHRPQAALDLVKEYSSSDTSFLRQVYAESALHSPESEADVTQMARRFAAIDQRGSQTYRREEAGFALYIQHDSRRALQLAQEDWTVQRTPEDMRVLLAAALAAQHPEAAQPVVDQLASSHFQYAVVVQLAARVRKALARRQVARTAGASRIASSTTGRAEGSALAPAQRPAR